MPPNCYMFCEHQNNCSTSPMLFSNYFHALLVSSYVGEQNAYRPDDYNCSFPAMISDWRKKFYFGSGFETSPLFPFGFVQVQAPRVRETKYCLMH